MTTHLLHRPATVLLLMILLSLLMRVFSFFISVMDHDESTYIVIASALLEGKVYLRDVIDTKPAGIFSLFALFMAVFGKSIFVIRLMTAVWVALTAWMLYLTHREIIKKVTHDTGNPGPAAGGIIYIFATSVYTYYGISPNTEHFFNLFTISALFLVIRHHRMAWFFASGLLLGCGYMIKYVVAFDALAIGLFYIWTQVTSKKSALYWITRCAVMVAGFAVPFMSAWMYYRSLGMEDTFHFISFTLSGRYFTDPAWHQYVKYVIENLLRFLPVTVWYFFSIRHWRTTGPALPVLGILWSVSVLFIVLLPGKLFSHYFIHLLLPMSLVAGSFFDSRRSPGPLLAWIRRPATGYPLLGLIVAANLYFQHRDYIRGTDYPKQVAGWLNTRLNPGDVLYTGDSHQIIYHLTGTESPTPYVHPSLLWDAHNRKALNVSLPAELQKIMARRPRFVLLHDRVRHGPALLPLLEKSYRPVKSFGREVEVYERNHDAIEPE